MTIFKKESGQAAMVVMTVLIVLLVVSGIGYQVNRSRNRSSVNPPVSVSPSPTTPTNPPTSPMGIDYPIEQGIKGKVFCNDKVDPVPCTTKVEIEPIPSNPSMGSYGPVKTVETDSQGNFSIELASGTYTITPEPKKDFPVFAPPLPNPVIVKDGAMTEITINYQALSKSSVN